MAVIGVLSLEMRFDSSHSLKEKRHYVKGLKDRLRNRYNVAVAEIDYQDLWQRALVAVATVASDRGVAEKTLQLAERDASHSLGPYLVNSAIEWID